MESTPRERYTEEEIRSHIIAYKREGLARLDALPFLDDLSVEDKQRLLFHPSISELIDETRRKTRR